MTRLGLRLALAGREAVAAVGLTAVAVAVGTAVLLFALSFAPATAERDARTAWRDSFLLAPDADTGTFLMSVEDRVEGRPLTRVHLAPAASGPSPIAPGVAAMPSPGHAFVSPALAMLMTALPADQLAGRIGVVAGTIDAHALASPDELVAVIGTEASVLRGAGALTVSGFATEPAALDLAPVGALIVVLAAAGALAPVAVFVSTATRMSAARREARLAALRLAGATPAQVARLAVIEALVATVLGSAAGIVLFLLSRPFIARIPLDATTWWPETIAPPLPLAAALLVTVQLVGALGALVTMRRLTITPLGVQRTPGPPSPPRARRVIPLAVGVVALFASISVYRERQLPENLALALIGLAFAGVVASIALVGPWLTAVVGRVLHRSARGAAGLLAGRRLRDEPRASFGAIAGVIMAVFVASAFFSFSAYAGGQVGADTDPLLRPGAVVARLGSSVGGDRVVDRVASTPGVTGAVPVREVILVRRSDGAELSGWIASCPDLVRTLAGLATATCADGGLTTTGRADLAGRYRVQPDRADPSGTAEPPAAAVDAARVPVTQLLGRPGPPGAFLPDVLVDPAALDDPGAAGLFPVTRIYATTDGTAAAGERARTAVVAAVPMSQVRLERERIASSTQFEEIGRIVALGLVGTLALAGCSLAVAVTTATLERRRQFVFLRSSGMPASSLRMTLLLQAGVPLVAVAGASAALGAFVGVGVLWVATGSVTTPDPSLVGVLALSLAVAMAIVAATLPPLERMTRPASVRHE